MSITIKVIGTTPNEKRTFSLDDLLDDLGLNIFGESKTSVTNRTKQGEQKEAMKNTNTINNLKDLADNLNQKYEKSKSTAPGFEQTITVNKNPVDGCMTIAEALGCNVPITKENPCEKCKNYEEKVEDACDCKLKPTTIKGTHTFFASDVSGIAYSLEPGKEHVVVIFKDGTKIKKAPAGNDAFDIKIGVALAIMEYMFGTKSQYTKFLRGKDLTKYNDSPLNRKHRREHGKAKEAAKAAKRAANRKPLTE